MDWRKASARSRSRNASAIVCPARSPGTSSTSTRSSPTSSRLSAASVISTRSACAKPPDPLQIHPIPAAQECRPMSIVRSIDRIALTRRGALLGGTAALLSAPLGRGAHAAAGTVVVSNWGGDWNQRTLRFVEAPVVETQGLTVVRDLGMEPERKAKLLAER